MENTHYPLRNSVRIILLNEANEVLLICIDDSKIKSIGGKYEGVFWVLIGGAIEANETIQEAAEREIFEETGIRGDDIKFGPVVWFGEKDLILYGKPIHIKEKYIVTRTKNTSLTLANLVAYETQIVKHLEWFSLNKIINSKEKIYPVLLFKYLPDIISGKYPKEPFEIKLLEKIKD